MVSVRRLKMIRRKNFTPYLYMYKILFMIYTMYISSSFFYAIPPLKILRQSKILTNWSRFLINYKPVSLYVSSDIILWAGEEIKASIKATRDSTIPIKGSTRTKDSIPIKALTKETKVLTKEAIKVLLSKILIMAIKVSILTKDLIKDTTQIKDSIPIKDSIRETKASIKVLTRATKVSIRVIKVSTQIKVSIQIKVINLNGNHSTVSTTHLTWIFLKFPLITVARNAMVQVVWQIEKGWCFHAEDVTGGKVIADSVLELEWTTWRISSARNAVGEERVEKRKERGKRTEETSEWAVASRAAVAVLIVIDGR